MTNDWIGIILLLSLGVFSVAFLIVLLRNRPRSTPSDKTLIIEESARFYDGR